MKALVTGGLGFIGSHLVDRLLFDNWDVVVLDNLLTGNPSNLLQHQNNGRLRVLSGDVRDVEAVKKASLECDAVFHLAAHALMRVSLTDRRADLDHNLVGTLNVLESMMENKISDFVFSSTSAIYGEAKVTPTPEDYFGNQTSLYGAAKLAGEAFAEAYTQFSDIKMWAFRFGTVLGERCRRGAIWDFVGKLRASPYALEILGDGNQKKDYLSVVDCINGIMAGYHGGKETSNVFNIGLQELTSVDRLADIVIREMHLSGVTKKYTGGVRGWVGDNPIVHLDVSKLRSVGWKPRYTAEEAISSTTEWTIANKP